MAVSQSKFYFQPSYNDMRWLLANQNSTFPESIEEKKLSRREVSEHTYECKV
jgi:hypothetical protein